TPSPRGCERSSPHRETKRRAARMAPMSSSSPDNVGGLTHGPELGSAPRSAPHTPGSFGPYGGRFVAETLVPALDELSRAMIEILPSDAFRAELADLLSRYVGRPTPVTPAPRLARAIDPEGTRIGEVWLKREDLCHTGAHKINNALGQVLLAK